MSAISLSETGIDIDGIPLSLPFCPIEFERCFSLPSRQIEVPLRLPSGAREIRRIKIYDQLGVFYLRDESLPIIPELVLCLCPAESPHALRQGFKGTIHAGSLLLTTDITPKQLKTRGALAFKEDYGNLWRFENHRISVSLKFCHPLTEQASLTRHNRLSYISVSPYE